MDALNITSFGPAQISTQNLKIDNCENSTTKTIVNETEISSKASNGAKNYGLAFLKMFSKKTTPEERMFKDYQKTYSKYLKDRNAENLVKVQVDNNNLIENGIDPVSGEKKDYKNMLEEELTQEYINVNRQAARKVNDLDEHFGLKFTAQNLEKLLENKNINTKKIFKDNSHAFQSDDILLDDYNRIYKKLEGGLNGENMRYLKDFSDMYQELSLRGIEFKQLKLENIEVMMHEI